MHFIHLCGKENYIILFICGEVRGESQLKGREYFILTRGESLRRISASKKGKLCLVFPVKINATNLLVV